jgi:transcriptional antiterminator RfaH
MDTAWYLLRTKAGSECRVREHLSLVANDVLLPLVMKRNTTRGGRAVKSVAALFPNYLFASFDLEQLRNVTYTRGVREVVRFGNELAVVPIWVINQIAERCRTARGLRLAASRVKM